MEYQVNKTRDGVTVLEILRGELKLSRGHLKHLKFMENGIVVNGKPVTVRYILREGDRLVVATEDTTPHEKILPVSLPLPVAYEDEDVVVPDKPANMPTHPSHNHHDDTVANALAFRYERLGIPFVFRPVNRLDRNTSGLVIAGKTLRGVQAVNEIIRTHKLDKYYLTLVAGEVREAGEITAYLTKDEDRNQVRLSKREGMGAKTMTKYRPIAHAKGYTLLEIHLITGKTHQIRAHMQSIGHPVVGDRKYGSEHSNEKFRKEYALSNQFLHALRVEWKEKEGPLGYLYGKELTAPLPATLQKICDGLFGRSE